VRESQQFTIVLLPEFLKDPEWLAFLLAVFVALGGLLWRFVINPLRRRRARRRGREEVVRDLRDFFRDRRVLHRPAAFETPRMVIDSIYLIRNRLDETLQKLSDNPEAARTVSVMQEACREFLNRVEHLPQVKDSDSIFELVDEDRSQAEEFSRALEKLRRVVNPHSEHLYKEFGIPRQSEYVVMSEPAALSLRVLEHMKSRGFNLSSERQVGDRLRYVFALPIYRGGHRVRFEIIPGGEIDGAVPVPVIPDEGDPYIDPNPRTRLSIEASIPDYQEEMEQWVVNELRVVPDTEFGS
jgi:hypothetical protein